MSQNSTVAGELVRTTAIGFELLIRLEIDLREAIVGLLGDEGSGWWKKHVPPLTRQACELRRKADRESSFAPRLSFHQIHYCYLEDLHQIVIRNRDKLLPPPRKLDDLRVRFEELLALRNRVAHARLITQSELTRLSQIVGEVRSLLSVENEAKLLTLQDPGAAKGAALEHLRSSHALLRNANPPTRSTTLQALLGTPTFEDQLTDEEALALDSVSAWLEKMAQLAERPGHRTEIRRQMNLMGWDSKLASATLILERLKG